MITVLGYGLICLAINICAASSDEIERIHFDIKRKLAYAGQWDDLWNISKGYKEYRLLQASSAYNWHEVKELVEKHGRYISLDVADDAGVFPLWCAVEAQNHDMIQFLLKHGADPNRPFEQLCWNVRALRTKDNTALFQAAYLKDVQAALLLLDHGANPHIRNAMGSTPLFAAVQANCIPLVQLLIRRGASANVQEKVFGITDFPGSIVGGDTPLIFAATKNNLKMVRLLLIGGARNIDAKNAFGQTARAAAMVHGNKSMLDAFACVTPQEYDEPKFEIISFTHPDVWID